MGCKLHVEMMMKSVTVPVVPPVADTARHVAPLLETIVPCGIATAPLRTLCQAVRPAQAAEAAEGPEPPSKSARAWTSSYIGASRDSVARRVTVLDDKLLHLHDDHAWIPAESVRLRSRRQLVSKTISGTGSSTARIPLQVVCW